MKHNTLSVEKIQQEILTLRDDPRKLQHVLGDTEKMTLIASDAKLRSQFTEAFKAVDPELAAVLEKSFEVVGAVERGDDSNPEVQRIKEFTDKINQHQNKLAAYKRKVDNEVEAVHHEIAPEKNKMYVLSALSALAVGGLTYAVLPPVGGLLTGLAIVGAGGVGAVAGSVAGYHALIKPKMAPHIQRWESEGQSLEDEGKKIEQEAKLQRDTFVNSNLETSGVVQPAEKSFAARYAQNPSPSIITSLMR